MTDSRSTTALDEPDRVPPGDGAGTDVAAATAAQIRGSGVLLAGRVVAMVVNGVTQVLIVRYLSRSDFGAFAYGLSVATLVEMVVTLGHRQSLTRFLSIYDERRDYDRLFGTILMVGSTVVGAGLVIHLGALALRGSLADSLLGDPAALVPVLILLAMGPLEALDDVFEGLFAVFARPRSIFVRKYVVNPALQLGVTLVLITFGLGVVFLAAGVVLGTLVAVAVYAWTLVRLLRRKGLLRHFALRRAVWPVREVFGFGVPLMTTQLVFLSMNSVSVVLLGRSGGAEEVAGLRAILPLAQINQIVIFTFTLLFMPLAARLFARGDTAGMRQAYWQTTAWLVVLSFPIFAVTGPLAEPLTLFLFGARYADSGLVLAVLATGLYLNAALGFNALTLQTYGRLRFVVAVNLAVVALNVGLNVVLIPAYGALGVAVASALTLVAQNLLNQAGLAATLGQRVVDARYTRVYVVVAGAAGALWALQVLARPPLAVGLVAAALATVAVFAGTRNLLAVGESFPELRRVPLLGRLVP